MKSRLATLSLDVVIVGAGISGLSAAIALAQAGHRVRVLDAFRAFQDLGGGMLITPNASRILRRWSLSEERFWATSVASPASLTVRRYSGTVLAHEPHWPESLAREAADEAPLVGVHRFDLQQALCDRARELGVEVQLGEPVVGVESRRAVQGTTAGAVVLTASGRCLEADLVVAADGLTSRCRALFLGHDWTPPRPEGHWAYRIVVDVDRLRGNEAAGLEEFADSLSLAPAMHIWIGPDAHATGYTLKRGNKSMYHIVLLAGQEGQERGDQCDAAQEMRALVEGWDPLLCRLVEAADHVHKWQPRHADELSSWVNDTSTLVFVGDACHPMLPYLGQGPNSAIEDGAVLGLLLGHVASRDDVPRLLERYEDLRRTRSDAVMRETFKQRTDFHLRDGPAQAARDKLFFSHGNRQHNTQRNTAAEDPFPSRWTCPVTQQWLFGYDAAQEVEEAVVA